MPSNSDSRIKFIRGSRLHTRHDTDKMDTTPLEIRLSILDANINSMQIMQGGLYTVQYVTPLYKDESIDSHP
jgi:hypothetical protein